MILYTPEEIKKIMEDNYDKSMDLPTFYHNLLREFKKEQIPAKTPLFTSEDGVPMYEDSIAWWVGRYGLGYSSGIQSGVGAEYYKMFEKDYKWFSTEEAAKAYWDKHSCPRVLDEIGIIPIIKSLWDKHKPKKVEVSDFGTYQEMYPVIPETWYQFMVTEPIKTNKFREISQAIEDILNK